MKKSKKGFTLIEMVIAISIIVLLVLLVGWIMNIYKLAGCDFDEPWKDEVVRGLGAVIFPMGVLIGFVDIDGDRPMPVSEKHLPDI